MLDVRVVSTGLACWAALLFLAGPAAQASVLVVSDSGGGGFTSVQAAVDAAANGDVLLIKPPAAPAYAAAVVNNKALTLVGDGVAAVSLTSLRIENLAAGKSVVVRDLKIVGGMTLEANSGSVRIEDCPITGAAGLSVGDFSGDPGLTITTSVDVAVERCTITGGMGGTYSISFVGGPGGHGTYVSSTTSVISQVVMHNCSVTGGEGGAAGQQNGLNNGGHGLVSVVSSRVHLSGCTITGGAGGDGTGIGACGNGGSGLVIQSGSQGQPLTTIQASTFQGGSAGFGFICMGSPGSAGSSAGTVVNYAGPAHQFQGSSPLREGQTSVLNFKGQPGDQVYLWVSAFGSFNSLPKYEGVFLVGFPTLGNSAIFFGTCNAAGEVNVSFPVPNLSVPGVTIHLLSVFRTGSTFYLGPASYQTFVDSAF